MKQEIKYSIRIKILKKIFLTKECIDAGQILSENYIKKNASFYVVLSDMCRQGLISYGTTADKHHQYSITNLGMKYLQDFKTRKLKQLYKLQKEIELLKGMIEMDVMKHE